MSYMLEQNHVPSLSTFGLHEIKGDPKPGLEQTVDEQIYKIMVDQRREINKKNLPDLN